MGLNESVEDLETQVNQLEEQLSDLQTKLTILEQGSKRRKQEVVSWIKKATKLTEDFPTLKERTIQGQWWEKYSSIDRVKKMREAVEDVKNDLRNIGELVVEGSTIPSLVDKNMNALKGQVTQLSSQAKDIETTLMNLERGGKKKRKLEVKGWLEQVEKTKNKFATFNIESITSLEDVQTMREEVKELRDDGKKFSELTVDVDESTIPSLDVSQLSGKSSHDNLEKLYGWLEDDKVLSIGVYGMGGVGKTTLVKHIHDQILQKMSHVNVYWVTVSQDFTIKKLQDEIAKITRLEFLDKIEEQRPAILHQHLVTNNVVLILDDVWDNIPLEKLGVPLRVKGCKLILTTRLRDVCRRIGCQKFFQVNVLNEEEGWNLFKEILIQNDHTVLTDDIEKHAKELAKKCGGLPLALNTVAASMRGVNDDHTWRNAIKNFQNASPQLEDLEKNVFEILKFSYNRLNDERWKKCFLYCCLYSEDEEIIKDEVIMKLIAEGLCEDRDEGHSILNKLVDVFLLEEGEWYVKMHDLMRDMALKMSKFMVKSEVIENLEQQPWIPELEKVSLDTSIKEIPNDFSPRCQNLSTLILVRNWWLKRIPETFLLYMTQLRVLDLSGNTNLKFLPNSISNLENLCGLFLQCCERISCLPKMEKLKALRVLNIRGCFGIRELPQDMECLVSLQYLYMRGTSKYLKIPKGVIAKLRNLRCLHLDYSGSGLPSEELNRLPHLQGFKNKYYDLRNFNSTTLVKKLEQLEWYDICVGMWDRIKLEGNKRNVYFEEMSFIGERGQVLLPANICGLKIVDCEGLNGCLADNFQSMSNVKELQVRGCKEVEWIFNNEQISEKISQILQEFVASMQC
ncbi:PREDICTED: probable disease resistance protein At4g27220 [Ipomoea nil]|uniref:probable disease resistance protein At4g27220 n=1 Tax=Ipomoea nil TaxID=35883 RepID=UPI0009015FD0|nr:PREDICTED: probable disease resistance protein At4g27220 [Ipomoea nil]